MNWIDWLLIGIVLVSCFYGWWRGMIRGALDIGTWVGSLVFGFIFYQPLGSWLHQITGWSEIWTRPVAFVLVIFVSLIVIEWIANTISRTIPQYTHLNPLNRFLGIFPGLFEGLVSAAIVALLLVVLPLPSNISSSARHSRIANDLVVQTERLTGLFNPVFGDAVSQALAYLTIPPGSPEQIDLHFKVPDPVVRPDLEADMLNMVNNERIIRGLEPLQLDEELRAVARQHSADMFIRGYFGHITPEGLSPFDRLRAANVNFLIAGENIALAPTISIAHQGLMNSPGHRDNILRPQFSRVGIGIMDGGQYGVMITQMFKD